MCILPTGDGFVALPVMPELAHSMFTRMYFYRGHGLKYFKPFSYRKSVINQEIYVYKVDWEGKEMNIIDEFKPKPKEVEETSSTEDNESIETNGSI